MATADCLKCEKELPLSSFRIWFYMSLLDRADMCKSCEGKCVYQIVPD